MIIACCLLTVILESIMLFILKERKITQAKLIRDLSISSAVPYKWLSGINEPSIENLIRLAEYFECSVDYLIGRVK